MILNNQKIPLSTEDHILVCLSSSPSNAKIIHIAGKMAQAYQCKLTALYVETPAYSNLSFENMTRLEKNTEIAKQYGASIEQVIGEDIAYQISEFARLNGVTKIIIGRSVKHTPSILFKKDITDRLISYVQNIEIFIIPDPVSNTKDAWNLDKKKAEGIRFSEIVKTVFLLTCATILSILFYQLGFTDANIVTIYILGVLFISIVTDHMLFCVLSSVASVFIFNFLFTDPRYTFFAYDIGYPMTFLVMLIASLITGTLASRLKKVASQSAKQAYRTKILLDTNQALQQAKDKEAILQTTMDQLYKLTNREMVFMEKQKDAGHIFHKENSFPIRLGDMQYGTVVINVENRPIDMFEISIISSILGESALALENERNIKETERNTLLAQQEKLRANLLRTISHDLRTPLTTICGNASNLMSEEAYFDEETRKQLYIDIYDDAMWLYGLVENLLSVTRMDGEDFHLNMTTELIIEVVEEALNHLDRRSTEYYISVDCEDDLLMVKMDAKLIIQVIINIVNNAIKYTPKGSDIHISIYKKENMAVTKISDNGPGIADDMKEKIFQLFYTGEHTVTDGRRSMGLGLALCRSIIEAHKGIIYVEDNLPHGTSFSFELPMKEVHFHE